jgi:hypothetical protein
MAAPVALAMAQPPIKKNKKSLNVCEGLIPEPQSRTYYVCTKMYWQYCAISPSSIYVFGTVGGSGDGIRTLFVKVCTDKPVPSQGEKGNFCVKCQEIQSKQWDNIRKTLRRAHIKYLSALEQIRLPVLGEASASMLKASVASTPDTNLTNSRRTFKAVCKAHLDCYYASVQLRIDSVIADNTDSTKGLEAGPNHFLKNFKRMYTEQPNFRDELCVVMERI